jgi:hypothetical protein
LPERRAGEPARYRAARPDFAALPAKHA